MAECIHFNEFIPLNVQKYGNLRWPSLCSIGVDLCVIFVGVAGKLSQWRSDHRLGVFSNGEGDWDVPGYLTRMPISLYPWKSCS